jgi:hypothetical protein
VSEIEDIVRRIDQLSPADTLRLAAASLEGGRIDVARALVQRIHNELEIVVARRNAKR